MEKNIQLKEIYEPIANSLTLLEGELDNTVNNLCAAHIQNVLKHSFRIPGKRMRPALLLLSAGAAANSKTDYLDSQLIKMAAALELIHTASLIHDDIIDDDMTRRGQKTLNNVYGNKLAVLTGDVLNSRAFLIISKEFPAEYHHRLAQMIEAMSIAEMEQIRLSNIFPSKNEYLNIISGKTAVFMANSCRFGAILSGGSKNEIEALENYGHYFGMAYQLVDDVIDKETVSIEYEGLKEAEEYVRKAKASINILKDTVYKQKLNDFLQYILNYAHL